MNNENFNDDYTQTLLTKLWMSNPMIDYGTLDTFINNLLHNEVHNCTIEQVSEFTESLTRNLEVIMMRKKKEIAKPKSYMVNGIELKKDYYSLRTEAERILRESPSSLNRKANEGIINILPGFKSKKVSAEEIYRYYCDYKKLD